jgi:CHASE3 domain sensor protein
MSFERTMMTTDRTLMSAARTLKERRHHLFEEGLVRQSAVHGTSALVSISVLMLVVGALAMCVATHSGIF